MQESLRLNLTNTPHTYIDSALNLFSNDTEIALAIINEQGAKFHGMRRQGNSNVCVDNSHSIFEIGSITKIFTSSILVKMMDQSLLLVDDSISEYLSYPLKGKVEISFRELSTHSAGLDVLPSGGEWDYMFSNEVNPYESSREQDIERYLQEELELGEKGDYKYSNLGAAILGYVLSKIKGQTYERLLRDEIFSPLDMNSSTTHVNQVSSSFIRGLGKNGEQVPNWEFGAFSPAGAVLSCTEDLVKFVYATLDEKNSYFGSQMENHFSSKEGIKMGLGWHIIGDNQVFHNGGTNGYTSALLIDSKKKNAVVVLSNISAFRDKPAGIIDELAFKVFDSLIDKSFGT